MKKTVGMQLSEMSKVFQSNARLNKSFYLDPIWFSQHHNTVLLLLSEVKLIVASTTLHWNGNQKWDFYFLKNILKIENVICFVTENLFNRMLYFTLFPLEILILPSPACHLSW